MRHELTDAPDANTGGGNANTGEANTAGSNNGLNAVNAAPQQGQSAAPTPTAGRIVMYTTAEGERWPAIVTRVEPNGALILTAFDGVFGPRNYYVQVSAVGNGVGEWDWPSRA
jgi:hypothetical protein